MIKNYLRRIAEKNAFLASLYRHIRDEVGFKRAKLKRMPMGFYMLDNLDFIKQGIVYEPRLTELIKSYLSDSDVFIDVGANIGYYSCMASSQGKHVIAIEPLGSNLRYLIKNLQYNGWDDVEVFPVGLGSKPSLTKIFGSGTGASLLRGWSGVSESYQKTIPTSTLDIVLGKRFEDKQLLVKVDVEGAEYKVVKGAVRALSRRVKPIWIVEICLAEHHPDALNPNFAKVFNIFWDKGYEAWSVGEQNRKVCIEDINRWIKKRKIDFGSHNFCFKAKV